MIRMTRLFKHNVQLFNSMEDDVTAQSGTSLWEFSLSAEDSGAFHGTESVFQAT